MLVERYDRVISSDNKLSKLYTPQVVTWTPGRHIHINKGKQQCVLALCLTSKKVSSTGSFFQKVREAQNPIYYINVNKRSTFGYVQGAFLCSQLAGEEVIRKSKPLLTCHSEKPVMHNHKLLCRHSSKAAEQNQTHLTFPMDLCYAQKYWLCMLDLVQFHFLYIFTFEKRKKSCEGTVLFSDLSDFCPRMSDHHLSFVLFVQ